MTEQQLVANIDAQAWAKALGGTTTFGLLDIGASFKFPPSKRPSLSRHGAREFVKTSKCWYKVEGGTQHFRTGSKTAVVEVK